MSPPPVSIRMKLKKAASTECNHPSDQQMALIAMNRSGFGGSSKRGTAPSNAASLFSLQILLRSRPFSDQQRWFTTLSTPRNFDEEHQETQRNVSPSEQEEDERGPLPTYAIKDLFKKWDAVRTLVSEWHPNQADVSRVGNLYNDNAINYLRKILKKRGKQSTLNMFFNAP
ncbi:uncharacterized protein TNCV_2874941 [Trichonephila clavipes]|nr:uncharacterized protein TNCV_2874941 [Trichonephila clavipes]